MTDLDLGVVLLNQEREYDDYRRKVTILFSCMTIIALGLVAGYLYFLY